MQENPPTIDEGQESRLPSEFTWLSDEVNMCPFPFYESLRTHAPVYQSPGCTVYGTGVYLISRWEDIVDVVERPEVFEQFLGDSAPEYTARAGTCPYPEAPTGTLTPFPIFYSDGDDHKEKRRVGLRLVDGQLLRSKEPSFRQLADEIVDTVAGAGECEFRTAIAEPYPQMIIHELIGLPREELDEWTSVPPASGAPQVAPVVGYVERLVLDAYKRPRDDLLSVCVREQADKDGGLDLNWHVANWSSIFDGWVSDFSRDAHEHDDAPVGESFGHGARA